MPECHRCEWNQRGPSPEKEAACGSCFMAEDYTNHKGKVYVSLDSSAAQTAAEVEASLQNARQKAEEAEEALPDCCKETAWRLIDFFANFTESELKVLLEVSRGATLAEVADGVKIGGRTYTRAGISIFWRRIVKKFPKLNGVLTRGKKRMTWQIREARAAEKRRDGDGQTQG